MENAHPQVREPEQRAREQAPIYVTEHVVAGDFAFPESFSVERLPGLMFYQAVTCALNLARSAGTKSTDKGTGLLYFLRTTA